MYACESILVIKLGIEIRIRTADLTSTDIGPTHEPHIIIKQKIALSLAFAHQKCRGSTLSSLSKSLQIDIAQDIDIMDEEPFLSISKKRSSMLDSATSLQEFCPFIREIDVHTLRMSLTPIFNHIGKMVDVDDHIVET